jgi:hypothetical protein
MSDRLAQVLSQGNHSLIWRAVRVQIDEEVEHWVRLALLHLDTNLMD